MEITRHTSPITTVDASNALGLIATGGYDGRVVVWTGGLVPRWSFMARDLVNHVAFSPSGDMLAAASADAFVYLLNVQDGSIRNRIGPFSDDVNAVAWHPDGKSIVCVMDAADKVIRLVDINSNKEIQRFEGHAHGIFAVAIEPSAKRIATAAEDGTARIWEVQSGQELARMDHPGDPETIAWSPTKPIVATGCDDGILRLWNVDTAQLVATVTDATAAVRFVRFSADGSRIMFGSYDGHLRIVNTQDFSVISDLTAAFQWERSAADLGSATVVGSFGREPIIHRYNGEANRVSETFGINCLATSPVKHDVLVGRDDGAIFDVQGKHILYRHDSIVNSVCLSDDGRRTVSCDYLGNLIIYDRRAGEISARSKIDSGPVNAVLWLSDESVVSAGYDGNIRLWSPDLKLKKEIQAHDGPIKSICFSRPAGMLIAGSSDDTISGWKNWERVYRIERDEVVLINSVAAATTADIFATASRDGLVRLWRPSTGELVKVLPKAHDKSVKSVAIAADGLRVISGSYDGYAALWSLTSVGGVSYRFLALHGKPGVPAVGFGDGRAFTAGWNGVVGEWSFEGSLLREHQLQKVP